MQTAAQRCENPRYSHSTPLAAEDVAPQLLMWGAAVVLLVEDAIDYERLGPDPRGYRHEAYLEMQRPGRILARLCGFADVDPGTVLACYRRKRLAS